MTADPEKIRTHTDHCLDLLRLHLQCAADVTPIAFYDVEGRGTPLPDFSTTHRCRKFDKVLDWVYDKKQEVKWRTLSLDVLNLTGVHT